VLDRAELGFFFPGFFPGSVAMSEETAVEFEVCKDGKVVASFRGEDRQKALEDAEAHATSLIGENGPVSIYEVTRTLVQKAPG
jgi:hypothetical protein